MRFASALTFAVMISMFSGFAQNSEVTGLNQLTEVELSQLSQRDPNPLAEKALAIHPDQ